MAAACLLRACPAMKGCSGTPPRCTSRAYLRHRLRDAACQHEVVVRVARLAVRRRASKGSEKTTRDRYAIRGYASTAAKHGIAVFTAIRDALAGKPWIPPIPAST